MYLVQLHWKCLFNYNTIGIYMYPREFPQIRCTTGKLSLLCSWWATELWLWVVWWAGLVHQHSHPPHTHTHTHTHTHNTHTNLYLKAEKLTRHSSHTNHSSEYCRAVTFHGLQIPRLPVRHLNCKIHSLLLWKQLWTDKGNQKGWICVSRCACCLASHIKQPNLVDHHRLRQTHVLPDMATCTTLWSPVATATWTNIVQLTS